MAEVIFCINNEYIPIQCQPNNILQTICNRFCSKVHINVNSYIFIYNDKEIDYNKTFSELANEHDTKMNKINILVKEKACIQKASSLSKNINPLNLEDNKINISETNNKKETTKISFDNFNNCQSNSILEEENNINYNNKCNIKIKQIKNEKNTNLSLFNSTEDDFNNIIELIKKVNKCPEHNDGFISICKTCNKHLCFICDDKEHEGHEILNLKKVFTPKKDVQEIINQKKNLINNKYYSILSRAINNLLILKIKWDLDLRINSEIIKNYNERNRSNDILLKIKKIKEESSIFYDFYKIKKGINFIEKMNQDISNLFNSNNSEEFNNNKYYNICNSNVITNSNININNNNNIYNKNIDNNIKEFKNANNNKIDNIRINYNINNRLENIHNNINQRQNTKDYSNNFNFIFKIKEFCKFLQESELFIQKLTSPNNFKNFNDNSENNKINNKINDFNVNNEENLNEIIMKYKIQEKDKKNKFVKITNQYFINENKNNNIKLIINGKESDLIEKYNISNYKCDILEIRLKGMDNIKKANYMFYECSSLYSLSNAHKWNTSEVINMSYLFYGCESLTYIDGISKWNTINVKDMSYMFFSCKSLQSLPDISKWNTMNVTKINHMFSECSSLASFPEISNWNVSNVIKMNHLFWKCSKLINLPDISKWNVENVEDMSFCFSECQSLEILPDISSWIISRVKSLNNLFENCKSLVKLPDISKWNTSKVFDMSHMFSGCEKLEELPDISNWDISKVEKLSHIFENCIELKNLCDISKWHTDKVKDMSYLFSGCKNLEILPDISKWNFENVKDISQMFEECINLNLYDELRDYNIKNKRNSKGIFNKKSPEYFKTIFATNHN